MAPDCRGPLSHALWRQLGGSRSLGSSRGFSSHWSARCGRGLTGHRRAADGGGFPRHRSARNGRGGHRRRSRCRWCHRGSGAHRGRGGGRCAGGATRGSRGGWGVRAGATHQCEQNAGSSHRQKSLLHFCSSCLFRDLSMRISGRWASRSDQVATSGCRQTGRMNGGRFE